MMPGRVLLVGAEDEENLAIRYLAAVVEEEGNATEIVACSRRSDFRNVLNAVEKTKPELIAVSLAFQSLTPMYFDLIKEIRAKGYNGHLTVGGHFATFEFKKILETQQGIDSVIRFEGETPIVALVDALQKKQSLSAVPNLVFKSNGSIIENNCICEFPDLDKLPFPVRKKQQDVRLGESFATLVASRGCWHSSCLFCCIGAFHSKKKGKRFALRSSESVAEEMAELFFKKGARLFQFHDDNFMMPTTAESVKRFSQLKNAIEAKGIPLEKLAFLIKARPDSIDDEVGKAMKELGVIGVFLGVENASETGLQSLNRKTTVQQVKNALRVLRELDMAITFNLLIFHPNATPEEIEQNIAFLKENTDTAFDFGRAEIVAGSPLETLAKKEGLINGNWPRPGYRIKDNRIERMFRIHIRTFHRENSPYTAVVHQNIAFSYHLHVLKRLHPGRVVDEISSEANRLVSKANCFIAAKLEEMYKMSEHELDDTEIEAFYKDLSGKCNDFYKEIIKLSNRMNRVSIADKVFNRFSVRESAQQTTAIRKILRL